MRKEYLLTYLINYKPLHAFQHKGGNKVSLFASIICSSGAVSPVISFFLHLCFFGPPMYPLAFQISSFCVEFIFQGSSCNALYTWLKYMAQLIKKLNHLACVVKEKNHWWNVNTISIIKKWFV